MPCYEDALNMILDFDDQDAPAQNWLEKSGGGKRRPAKIKLTFAELKTFRISASPFSLGNHKVCKERPLLFCATATPSTQWHRSSEDYRHQDEQTPLALARVSTETDH